MAVIVAQYSQKREHCLVSRILLNGQSANDLRQLLLSSIGKVSGCDI